MRRSVAVGIGVAAVAALYFAGFEGKDAARMLRKAARLGRAEQGAPIPEDGGAMGTTEGQGAGPANVRYSAVIAGSVVDEAGAPVARATVCTWESVTDPNAETGESCTATDRFGRFRFDGVRARDRELRATLKVRTKGKKGATREFVGNGRIFAVDTNRQAQIVIPGAGAAREALGETQIEGKLGGPR